MLSASQWLEEGLRQKLQKKREDNIVLYERLLVEAKRDKAALDRASKKLSYSKTKRLIHIDVSVSK